METTSSQNGSTTQNSKKQLQENHDAFFLGHLQKVQGKNGSYYTHKFLGKGGNGTAFLVTSESNHLSGLQLVLKVFHKVSDITRRKAFLDEISRLRGLDHPAIISVFDEGVYTSTKASYPFAVIEYQPRNLRDAIWAQDISRIKAIRITLNCLSALSYIHGLSEPLVHRDIKPENILISDTGAKLADFGLSKLVEEEQQSEQPAKEDSEHNSQWPGMPFRYRTPELIQRAKDSSTIITARSDVFQMGTVFYELLTGFNPQIMPDKIIDPLELDVREIDGAEGVAMYDLVRDMLHVDPQKRPSASECLERLNRIHRSFCRSLSAVMGEQV